jgi:hypothetical protein
MYTAYYFQEGETLHRLVAVIIDDSSELSYNLRIALESRLNVLAGLEWNWYRTSSEECNFASEVSSRKETQDEEAERRR